MVLSICDDYLYQHLLSRAVWLPSFELAQSACLDASEDLDVDCERDLNLFVR